MKASFRIVLVALVAAFLAPAAHADETKAGAAVAKPVEVTYFFLPG